MNHNALTENESRSAVVAELLQRRAKVTQWLQRLESQRGTVSDKILDRVRADYENRLRDTVDELRSHRESLASQLDESLSRLASAKEEHTSAEEAFEEGRLRNAIGELNDDAWSRERTGLQAALDEAGAAEAAAREEAERLRELVEQFAETGAPVEPQPGPSPVAEAVEPEPEPAPQPEPRSFLSDIDRAISDVDDDSEDRPDDELALGDPDELPTEETMPKPGLKCADCGYTNDLSAWFCGVCGSDIG